MFEKPEGENQLEVQNSKLKSLESLKSYASSDDSVKRIITAHILMPSLSKSSLAKQLGYHPTDVENAFSSKAYEDAVIAISRQEINEMTLFATDTLRKLLNANDSMVRLRAALAILHDRGVMSIGSNDTSSKKNPVVINVAGFWNNSSNGAINGQLNDRALDVE